MRHVFVVVVPLSAGAPARRWISVRCMQTKEKEYALVGASIVVGEVFPAVARGEGAGDVVAQDGRKEK